MVGPAIGRNLEAAGDRIPKLLTEGVGVLLGALADSLGGRRTPRLSMLRGYAEAMGVEVVDLVAHKGSKK